MDSNKGSPLIFLISSATWKKREKKKLELNDELRDEFENTYYFTNIEAEEISWTFLMDMTNETLFNK